MLRLLTGLLAVVGASYMIEKDVRTVAGRQQVMKTTEAGIETVYNKAAEIAEKALIKAKELADEVKAQSAQENEAVSATQVETTSAKE